jgi:hypothetical protein
MRVGLWTEVIGTVDEVGGDFVVLKVAYTLHISREEVSRWIHRLRKGSRVGILFMDNGIRVRVLDEGQK